MREGVQVLWYGATSQDLKELQQLATKISGGFSAFGSGANMSVDNMKALSQLQSKYNDIMDKYSHSNDSTVANAFNSSKGLSQSSTKTISDSITATDMQSKLNSSGYSVQLSGTDAFKEAMMNGYGSEVVNKYHGNTVGEKILDMSVHGQADMNKLANDYANSPQFISDLAGKNPADYTAHGPNVDNAKKLIVSNSSHYANSGNVDKVTEGASAATSSTTVLPANLGPHSGNQNQTRWDMQDKHQQGVDFFNKKPAENMGRLVVNTTKTSANVVTADVLTGNNTIINGVVSDAQNNAQNLASNGIVQSDSGYPNLKK